MAVDQYTTIRFASELGIRRVELAWAMRHVGISLECVSLTEKDIDVLLEHFDTCRECSRFLRRV